VALFQRNLLPPFSGQQSSSEIVPIYRTTQLYIPIFAAMKTLNPIIKWNSIPENCRALSIQTNVNCYQ
jgi:hypothetical protein